MSDYRCRFRRLQQGVEGAALKTAEERVLEGRLETEGADRRAAALNHDFRLDRSSRRPRSVEDRGLSDGAAARRVRRTCRGVTPENPDPGAAASLRRSLNTNLKVVPGTDQTLVDSFL